MSKAKKKPAPKPPGDFHGVHLLIVDRGEVGHGVLPLRDLYFRDGLGRAGQSCLMDAVEVPAGYAERLVELFASFGVPVVRETIAQGVTA